MSSSIIMNEKIRASEVHLTGLRGEDFGIVSRDEALAKARELKADLVCTSLMSSPPPCKLVAKGQAKQQAGQEIRSKAQAQGQQPAKVKELRLTPHIEEHDYDTKLRQAAKLLGSGNGVQLVVRIQGKEGAKAKELLERLVKDLAESGRKQTGIQVSGKQAAVQLIPL
ncbi:translation initiation factor IF-3 [Paenibacillus sp. N4]|uniref:translation initiation factor IF-3 n=1 Tax=Paenibacillus vietnamensis TaxID=2590547 RepID=UPI001CD056D2|nr:translation initiation factor IF-3 [Paenibacillus vietnamensis]MCA0756459.1 translation initiation factor IF-3 [Paenibacillus vietnamensis]